MFNTLRIISVASVWLSICTSVFIECRVKGSRLARQGKKKKPSIGCNSFSSKKLNLDVMKAKNEKKNWINSLSDNHSQVPEFKVVQ